MGKRLAISDKSQNIYRDVSLLYFQVKLDTPRFPKFLIIFCALYRRFQCLSFSSVISDVKQTFEKFCNASDCTDYPLASTCMYGIMLWGYSTLSAANSRYRFRLILGSSF